MIKSSKLFVDKSREKEFCRENSMELVRLPNGSIVLGISRNANDSFETSINVSFPSGFYFDPPGKIGAHHLLEHLINNDMLSLAEKNGARLNAVTEDYRLKQILTGPYNPKFPGFGIAPFIPIMFDRLANLPISPESLAMEKAVIKSEINEKNGNYDYVIEKWINENLCDEANPCVRNFAQTPESIEQIHHGDLEKLAKNVFIPNGTIASVLTDAPKAALTRLVSDLSSHMQAFPRKEVLPPKAKWALLDKIKKSEFKKSEIRGAIGLKNNLITIFLIWEVSDDDTSVESAALKILLNKVGRKFFGITRANGWGYSAGSRINHGEKRSLAMIGVNVPKMDLENLNKLIEDIRINLPSAFAFNDDEIKELVDTEQLRCRAIPFASSAKLNWTLVGLLKHNQMFNFNKIRENYQNVDSKDITSWLEFFFNHKPLTVVVGDLPNIN